MIVQDEILLMGFVIGLYLFDSILLLHANEGILTPGGSGKWSAIFGSRNFQIFGKDTFIPNPFLPHRPIFRLSWDFEGAASNAEENWLNHVAVIRPLVPMVWCIAAALFVFLPLGFFTRLGDKGLLFAIALLYLSIATALVWIWLNRSAFKLSGKRFASLAFEVLICSPFALNLIRKVSLGIPVTGDLVQAARRLLDPQSWETAREVLVSRLSEAMEYEEEGSERLKAMANHHRKLTKQPFTCQ